MTARALAGRLLAVAMLAVSLAIPPGFADDGADATWRGTEGEFGALLLVTPDARRFLADARAAVERGDEPEIQTTTRVHRGEEVSALIVVFGCAGGPSGACDTTVDFRVLAPDGSVYAEFLGTEAWAGAPPPPGVLQPGSARLDLDLEPEDALGGYRVEAVVHDRVAGHRVSLWAPLEVVPVGR